MSQEIIKNAVPLASQLILEYLVFTINIAFIGYKGNEY